MTSHMTSIPNSRTCIRGASETRRRKATGVQISYEGSVRRIRAGREVILSLGAIHTPKVLMQSAISDEAELDSIFRPVTTPGQQI
jgi:choline dehydrogenase-like flavoprotein